jgi:hypothetical protein
MLPERWGPLSQNIVIYEFIFLERASLMTAGAAKLHCNQGENAGRVSYDE